MPLDNINALVTGRPFSSNLELQAYTLGFGLSFDKEKMNALIDKEPDNRFTRVLRQRIEDLSDIIFEPQKRNVTKDGYAEFDSRLKDVVNGYIASNQLKSRILETGPDFSQITEIAKQAKSREMKRFIR